MNSRLKLLYSFAAASFLVVAALAFPRSAVGNESEGVSTAELTAEVEALRARVEALEEAMGDLTSPPSGSAEPGTTTTTIPGTPVDTTSTTTTTPPEASTQPPATPEPTTPPTEAPRQPQRLVYDKDTMVTEALTLRPGDSLELRNGARLMFTEGGFADWQGTPVSTWSDHGAKQNLERDVSIFGEGDIMFMAGSKPSTIRYVSVDLKPKRALGHYPLHWHMVYDDARGTLVEGVVVKNSTNHCVVPHGSHGITFKDVICKNIVDDAFWWDPPSGGAGNRPQSQENNSNDIVVERMLIDGVKPVPGDNGYKLTAFLLGAGSGNSIRNSVAMNVEGSKDCSGYHWPSTANNNDGGNNWAFVNNVAHSIDCSGIFVWQNGSTEEGPHVIEGFRAWNLDRDGKYPDSGAAINHGAYSNLYRYVDPVVDSMTVHATGWSVVGGRIDEVVVTRNNEAGTVVFTDTAIERLTINNHAKGRGKAAITVVANGTGLTCRDVGVQSIFPGSKVVIDGKTCRL